MADAARARELRAREVGELLARNRREALALQQGVGGRELRRLLERAQRDLEHRVRDLAARGAGGQTFTLVQLHATLRQLEQVLRELSPGIKGVVVAGAQRAADQGAAHVADYLRRADEAFRGAGAQPLALREARMMSAAMQGAQSSVLRRLASSGEPVAGADAEPHPAKAGVLQRYGAEVVGHFERELQKGVLARKTRAEMAEDLRERSPFLRGAPAHWAERIVRTELHAASNRAGWEAVRDADEQLGDMLKVLSCVFDERTGADSVAVHGQVRRPAEAFETWNGLSQHPPDRPNDRAAVTPHRLSWPVPAYLLPRPWGEVLKRWAAEGRKGAPPERPPMTTVPLGRAARGG